MSKLLDQRLLRRFDWPLLFCLVALLGLGLPTIYSALLGANTHVADAFVRKQVMCGLVGLAAMILVNTLDHHHFPDLTRPVYWLCMALLLAVLVAGKEVNGHRSWLSLGGFRLQPSEFTKIAVILALSEALTREDEEAWRWPVLGRSIAVLAVPFVLIMGQPDLGTALTFIAVWLVLLGWCGAKAWQLAAIVLGGLVAFAVLWKLGVVADYQKARLLVMFNPQLDARGEGYNLRQSLIAIGSGGMGGQGWQQGTQTHLRFLPERHTDFVFAVFSEERGFTGVLTALGLYLGLLWRGWGIAGRADTPYGRAVAVGCVTLIMFHVVLNTGMVAGLFPITGVPLVLFSYGGSSLMTTMIVVGILLNIGMRRTGLSF